MSPLDALGRALRRQRIGAAYRQVFGTPEGKVVLRDLLGTAGVLAVSHEPGDSHHTAFVDGRRSMGLEIMQRMRWTEGELNALAAERTAERLAIGAGDDE